MGMYTEIMFRGRVPDDAPSEVLAALNIIAYGEDATVNIDHPLFQTERWTNLGRGTSYYFPEHAESFVRHHGAYKYYDVFLSADLKNYHSEIELFFDWINPYVDALPGEFLGYSLYEGNDPETAPTPYFKKETN